MRSALNKKRTGLVNLDTGALLGTVDQYDREQRAQKAANAYMWARREEKFVFARMEAVGDIIAVLTRPQIGLFLVLQTFADYEGIIRNTALQKENKTVMTNQDVMRELEITKQTFSDFINKCLEHKIIIKTNDGSYKLNSKYHFRGKKKEGDKLVKILNTEVRKMSGKIKWADLGLLYSLIPHINFVTNTICSNPYETDPTKIKKLNQKQICELLGITKPTFNRLLDMEYEGKVVFAEVRIKRKYKSYLVNPWVMYRLDGTPNDSLIEEEVDPYNPDKTLQSIFSIEGAE